MAELATVTTTSARRSGLPLVFGLALAGAVGATLWASSFPGVPFSWALLAVVLWSAALGLGLVVIGTRATHRGRALAGLALLLTIVLVVAVQRQDLGAVRFSRSLSAFEAVVAEAGPVDPDFVPRDIQVIDSSLPADQQSTEPGIYGPFPTECPRRIGSYSISSCETFEGGYLFEQRENAVTDSSGIVYLPDGPSLPRADGRGMGAEPMTHLVGPWYSWTCHC